MSTAPGAAMLLLSLAGFDMLESQGHSMGEKTHLGLISSEMLKELGVIIL